MDRGRACCVFADHAQTAFQRVGEGTIVRIEHFGVGSTDLEAFDRSREGPSQSERIDAAHVFVAGQQANRSVVRLYLMDPDRVLERTRGAYRRLSVHRIIDGRADSS